MILSSFGDSVLTGRGLSAPQRVLKDLVLDVRLWLEGIKM